MSREIVPSEKLFGENRRVYNLTIIIVLHRTAYYYLCGAITGREKICKKLSVVNVEARKVINVVGTIIFQEKKKKKYRHTRIGAFQ